MNIIFARYDSNAQRYCFYVPESVTKKIEEGDILKVQTRYGNKFAIAITGIISGEGTDEVARMNGASFPLEPVLLHIPKDAHDFIIQQYLKGLLGGVECSMLF